eukprot:CAMPEP_0194254334 /NCGR_PEP_ID=MMETSP0158-20130606/31906_1 /TAXON_ID=33649 /ORGANISM="Thalassionema nitzschioides, Strain L26-B" /LENGTH=289 /DNA_ID=CAMNT_0038992319 /DNA_START=53 /DNA_END=922 /DNA_ORIENTATION=-
MRLDLLWKKSTEDTEDSCSIEEALESTIGARINNEKRKIAELRYQMDVTRRIVLTRQELESSRLENKQSLVLLEETVNKAQDHLAFLSIVFSARLKKKHPMSFYRQALMRAYNDGDQGEKDSKKDTMPAPYVFDLQGKLLECFHWTEIFRSQWARASDHLVRTTQQLMHEKSRLKDRSIKLEFGPVPILSNPPELNAKLAPRDDGKNQALEKKHNSEGEEFIDKSRGEDNNIVQEEEHIKMVDIEMSESSSNGQTSKSLKNLGLNGGVPAEIGKKQAALLWGDSGKREQ